MKFISEQDYPDHQRENTAVEKDKETAASVEDVKSFDENGAAEGCAYGHDGCKDKVGLPVAEQSKEVKGGEKNEQRSMEGSGDEGSIYCESRVESIEAAVPEGGEQEVGLHCDCDDDEEGAQTEE